MTTELIIDSVTKYLSVADSGRQKCSLCHRTIPKNVQRLSVSYNTRYGSAYIRVCGLCLIKAGKHVNDSALDEWGKELMLEEI